MGQENAQKLKLRPWERGDKLSAEHLDEAVQGVRALRETVIVPQQAETKGTGFNIYRVTEAPDQTTWLLKAVLVNDTNDTNGDREAISTEQEYKVAEGSYSIQVGDLVTNAKNPKNPNSRLVTPISPCSGIASYKVVSEHDDVLKCNLVGDDAVTPTVYWVAKPWLLRKASYDSLSEYTYVDKNTRDVDNGDRS